MQERFFIKAPHLREAYFGSCHGEKLISVSYSNSMIFDLLYIMEHFMKYEIENNETMVLRTSRPATMGMTGTMIYATLNSLETSMEIFTSLKHRIQMEAQARLNGLRSANFLIDDFAHLFLNWYGVPNQPSVGNSFLIMKDHDMTSYDFANENRVIVIRNWPSRSERFGRAK